MTPEDKQKQLHLSLDEKIKQSKMLIMDWYYQFKGQVYVAFSGGKDSTVLLHLVRSMFPEVPAVFVIPDWNILILETLLYLKRMLFPLNLN